MATCYDCIHCDACSDAGDSGFSSLKEDVNKCKHFKNKAEYVEVKHGEWIKTYRGVRKNENTGQPMRVYAYDCSCCGWHTGNQGAEFKRCPMCGAIMDVPDTNDGKKEE